MSAPLLTLRDAARVAGHSRWLEMRLFEVVGEWVAAESDPAVKAMLARQSLHHAWHADVWRDRVPLVAHLDADELTVPAGPGAVAMVDTLAATAGPDQTVERLVSLARVVLPRLVAAYGARLEAAHPLADGPTVRWLGHVVADEAAALGEVEARLAAVLGGCGPEGADRASAHEAAEGAVLPGGGGLIGLAVTFQA